MKQKTSEEFEKFDKVMGGLLAVPYTELQGKLEDEKRAKAKAKKKRASSFLPASVRASSSSKKRVA